MDINYFLLMRGKYNSILNQLDLIIDDLNDTYEFTDEYLTDKNNIFSDIFGSEITKNFFIEKKTYILYLKNLCNTYIQKMCSHEFIEDYIDINPDTSKTISYCKYCEMNNPDMR